MMAQADGRRAGGQDKTGTDRDKLGTSPGQDRVKTERRPGKDRDGTDGILLRHGTARHAFSGTEKTGMEWYGKSIVVLKCM